MDGVGGTVKNVVYRAVMSEKITVNSAKDFARQADKLVEGIKCVYLPMSNIMNEPDSIASTPYHPDMKVHGVHGKTHHHECRISLYAAV